MAGIIEVTVEVGEQTHKVESGKLIIALDDGRTAKVAIDVFPAPQSYKEEVAPLDATLGDGLVEESFTEAPQLEVDEPQALTGELPEDFPGLAALHDAEIKTYEELRDELAAGEGNLTHIAGIGDATNAKILTALEGEPSAALERERAAHAAEDEAKK